ncbi:MAG: nucleotide exchange factor GrpE, partial [Paramuribaculum sp.]|nr:nucleotide exchange factor GrpE [Paramuribaculum sp.]
VKYLEQNGVKAMESNGADFDPDMHEAIAMVPVEDQNLKGKVIDTPTKGYTINDKVLRHAKVAVGQ